MPDSGSGTMTAIPLPVPGGGAAASSLEWRTRDKSFLPVRLTDYREMHGIPSLFFWGVHRGDVVPGRSLFFSGEDRRRIKHALRRACDMIESQLRIHLVNKWRTETHAFVGKNPVRLEKQNYVATGPRTISVYDTNVAVVYSGEYGYVTVAHGGAGAWDEVRCFYCDGSYDEGPEPWAVEFGASNIRLTFKRETLVKPSVMNTGVYERNSEYQPASWSIAGNFCAALTVAREYTDTTAGATIRQMRACENCAWQTQTACVRAEDEELGRVNVIPATYTGGKWCRTTYRAVPEALLIEYESGLTENPPGLEEAIVRLAHAIMPSAPCADTAVPWYGAWQRDQNVNQSFSRERLNCPWGPKDGAWFAWNYCMNLPWNQSKGGGLLGTMRRKPKWQSSRTFW